MRIIQLSTFLTFIGSMSAGWLFSSIFITSFTKIDVLFFAFMTIIALFAIANSKKVT